MDFANKLKGTTSAKSSGVAKKSSPHTSGRHIPISHPHEETDDEEDLEPRRTRSRNGSRSRRSSGSATETLAIILSERLSVETSRVSQLTAEVDDQRRAYTLLLSKYSALQTACTELQLELEHYKVKFEAQRAETYKAQDVVADVDRRRRDAEQEAVRGRQKVRELKTDLAVRNAKEGGWKLGFQQGAREAGMLFGGMLGRHRRRDEVLDEEREEQRAAAASTAARKRSSSRSRPAPVQASSSSGSSSNSPEAPAAAPRASQTHEVSPLPRPDTPGINLRSTLAGITRHRSSSRHRGSRSRSRSNSDAGPPSSSGTPAPDVPALPVRPPSRPQTETSRRSQPTVINETEDNGNRPPPRPATAMSDTSTRISEYDLVGPPRARGGVDRQEQPTTPTPRGFPPSDIYSRQFDRPQTSHGYRPTTPLERALGYHGPESSTKRMPHYRHQSSGGGIQIEVQSPTQSSSSSSRTPNPLLLNPKTPPSPLTASAEGFEDGLDTANILDAISRDKDTSYFPYEGKTDSDVSDERSYHATHSRSSTPRGGRVSSRRMYEPAPIPPGVVYPRPPLIRRGSTPGGAPSPAPSSSSSSSGSGPSSKHGSRRVGQHKKGQNSLSGVSPATLHRPFSIFSEDDD